MTEMEEKDDNWIPQSYPIPDHWLYTELETAFDNLPLTGKKLAQKNYDSTGEIPVVDQGASEIGGYSNDQGKLIEPDRPVIIFGDHTKCLKYVNFPFIPGADGVKVLLPRSGIDPKYAFYACKSLRLPDRGYSRHYSFLKKCDFPLPPSNEQKRIVAKIEELFSKLDNGMAALKTARGQLKVYRQAVLKHAFEGKLTAKWREENAEKLESPEQLLAHIQQEREARYLQQLETWKAAVKAWEANGKEGKKPGKPQAFKPMEPISNEEIVNFPTTPDGWKYSRLAEISSIGSGMSVSKDRKLSDPIEVPYLRVANVQRGTLILDEIKKMHIERGSLSDLALEKWDVLFNEGGDRDKLGRGWIWEGQISPCITQNHVFRASPILKREYHAKFISHWGNSFGKDYFEKGGKQTTNLASINKTVLSNFPVPLPSMAEQQQLINMLDEIMSQVGAMETEVENGIQRAEALRQSILKKAFSGQLVPQDSSDEPASELLARIQTEKTVEKAKQKTAAKPKATAKADAQRGRKPKVAC